MRSILGAGPAGLTCAINLAKSGERVKVYEIRKDVGMRFHPNLQGLKYLYMPPEEFMAKMGIGARIEYRYFPKAYICTRKREIEFDMSGRPLLPFVERGGRNSLEYRLYEEALSLGVEFEFGSKRQEREVDVVASGAKRADAAAVGRIYEDTDFPRDHYLVMFDDRFSPKGWYSYIIPTGKDVVEFVTCVSKPYIPLLHKLLDKAILERRIIGDFLAGKKILASFGGAGGVWIPKTAVKEGRYYVGEAAGFQDAFMGFGITHAIRSGKFAADAMVGKGNYDAMWKREILPYMRKDFAWRFPAAILGDWVIELGMRKYSDKNRGDLSGAIPEKSWWYKPAEAICFHLEQLHYALSGSW
ncbi:MAG: NAD(P)/FAD-dependent oxidoreductase [Candidatus Micrarchaeota archaeon]|nr:NAD(P)/FAD-dependent oxidoreductase [Candidatus Micrarchaeota archaeon]